MQLILTDSLAHWTNLLPITATKPIAALRVGILTMGEKWQKHLQITEAATHYLSNSYLQHKYKMAKTVTEKSVFLYVNSSVCPDSHLAKTIAELPMESMLVQKNTLIVLKTKQLLNKSNDFFATTESAIATNFTQIEYAENLTNITAPYHIFLKNREQIIVDYQIITANRKSQPITDPYTKVYGLENIFVEEGASIKAAILNAEEAPIYIGKNTKIHEGAIIKGAFALCEGAEVNMAAKIKGDTTVGIFSKVGGEISNSVIMGYSNKGHDGFLGNSVIGEWCNLGADTNTSNLKNNYSQVKIWNYAAKDYTDTGLQFCGTMMADHAKCSINTMLNTGTVVGVGANIFGADFPPKFVPDFSWGGSAGFETFEFDKFCQMTEKVMARRNLTLTTEDKEILQAIFQQRS